MMIRDDQRMSIFDDLFDYLDPESFFVNPNNRPHLLTDYAALWIDKKDRPHLRRDFLHDHIQYFPYWS